MKRGPSAEKPATLPEKVWTGTVTPDVRGWALSGVPLTVTVSKGDTGIVCLERVVDMTGRALSLDVMGFPGRHTLRDLAARAAGWSS